MVDANLRNPGIAKAFGVNAKAFLDQILGDDESADNLFCRDSQTRAVVIAARGGATSSEHLLSSNQFQALIEDLKRRFDFVLIDTPDLEGSSDALHAATAADTSLFVVRADTAGPERIVAAMETLTACQRQPLGVVLNRFRAGSSGFFTDDKQPAARKLAAPGTGGFGKGLTEQPAGV